MKISEDRIQQHLFEAYARLSGQLPEFDWFFHIPNGGSRNIREAIKFKSMGVKPGIPDIILPVAKQGYHGLAIELKAGKNKPTEHQLRWIEFLRSQQWYVAVCYSWEDALYCSILYCELNPNTFFWNEQLPRVFEGLSFKEKQ